METSQTTESYSIFEPGNIFLFCVLMVILGAIFYKREKPKFNRQKAVYFPKFVDRNIIMKQYHPLMLNTENVPRSSNTNEIMTSKLGDTIVNIEFYDTNNPIPPELESEMDCPATYPFMMKELPLENLLTYQLANTHYRLSMQYKTILPHSHQSPTVYDKLSSHFMKKVWSILNKVLKKFEFKHCDIQEINLSVATNPWNCLSHFEGFDNFVVGLFGTRRYLLYKLHEYNEKGELKRPLIHDLPRTINFIKYLGDKSLKQSYDVLKENGVACKIVDVRCGDLLYIPAGTYFRVESVDNTDLSVCMNVNLRNKDEAILRMWNRFYHEIWKPKDQDHKPVHREFAFYTGDQIPFNDYDYDTYYTL
jgi:hypothetical protein